MSDDRADEPEDLDTPPSFFPYEDDDDEEQRFTGSTEPVKVRVEAVFATQTAEGKQYFVLLSDGERKLPIVIGQFEAAAITFPLEGQQPDRPMTHDLFRNVLQRLEIGIKRVYIDDLWGTTYYAKVVIEKGGEELIIDSRPSDAIAMAVRCDAPIFVADGILDQQGH